MTHGATGLPGEHSAGSERLSISATDHSFAANHVGAVNYHIHGPGRAALGGLLAADAPSGATGGAVGRVKAQLIQQSPDIELHAAVTEEFSRMRDVTADVPANRYDDTQAADYTTRVIEAARIPVGVAAVLAFWGDADTDSWWMPELERLARIAERGGSPWVLNLPRIAASLIFYAAGAATVHRRNYARLRKMFRLYGESPAESGPVPLRDLLVPISWTVGLTSSQSYDTVSPTLVEVLNLRPDVIEDAWQRFEILRLAAQLMSQPQFNTSVGTYTAAIRRGQATAQADPTATHTAEAAKNNVVDEMGRGCSVKGLHLRAVDKVFRRGADFRWGSDVAEWLADEVGREGDAHPMVAGLDSTPESTEIALRAVSRAVGEAGKIISTTGVAVRG